MRVAGKALERCIVLVVALGVRAALGQGLSLHEAVRQALTGPQAQAIGAQVDEVGAGVRQAGLGLNPRLFLESEDLRPWADSYDFPTQTEDFGYLSQTFELDGKRQKRVALAKARLEQTRAEADAMRAQIAGRVAGAYWNAVVLGRIAQLLGEDMVAVDEMVRYHQARVDAGAMRGVDLLRMQIERDRLEVARRAAERDAELARLELFRQMGRAPVDGVNPTDALDGVAPVPPVELATVLARRADVLAAREAVAAAEADVRLQQANGVPDLDLLGGYKRNLTQNTGFGGLQIPLAFRNRNQGEVARAQASVRYTTSRLAALEVQVGAEVAEGEANYRREREIVETSLPGMRQKARENFQLMTEAYRIGGVDLLRYLDAERTAFDVEVSALRIEAEYQQAALRVQMSYGVQP